MRRSKKNQMRKTKKERAEELCEDEIIDMVLRSGGTVLHLEKDSDDVVTIESFDLNDFIGNNI